MADEFLETTEHTPDPPLPSDEEDPNLSPQAWGSLFEFLKTIGFVLIMAFLIRQYIIQPFVVDGQSMEPNFHNAEYILVDKVSYRTGEPQRGDVIVFRPVFREDNYIKRIIGLPGEIVEIKGNQVFVNNQEVPESYLGADWAQSNASIASDDIPVTTTALGSNEFYVLGDNRDHSQDSRVIGPIPRENIVGRAWVVLFPLETLSLVQRPAYPTLMNTPDKQAVVGRLTPSHS